MIEQKKRRVLQMIRSLDVSGAEKFGLELARALPKDEFEVILCAFFEHRTPTEMYWRQQLSAENIRVITFADGDLARRWQNYLSGALKLRNYLRVNPVDIIHSHFSMGTVMGLISRNAGFSQFVMRTAHGQSQYEWSPRWYSHPWRKFLFNWVYPISLDAETGVSEAITKELQSPPRVNRSRRLPELIHNGISEEFIQAAHPIFRAFGSSEGWKIGSIGRLSTQKGYMYLIQAMPTLLARLPNVRLEIVGEGELKTALVAEIGRLGLQAHVAILPKSENVIPFLQNLDLFVLPSLWEGLPTVVLESMACGTPVLATDISGTRELVQDGKTGWLVKPADPSALANRIFQALGAAELLNSASLNSLELIKSYSFKHIAIQFVDLYRLLMVSQKRSTGIG